MLDRATPAMRGRLAIQIDHLALVDLGRRRRTYSTTRNQRTYAKRRRDGLRGKKLCINGALHGPATHGSLCMACRETHRRTA